MLCDPKISPADDRPRATNPAYLGELYGDLINTADVGRPSRPWTITMHLCRGNYKSTFMGARAATTRVQEILFNKINVATATFMGVRTTSARAASSRCALLPKGKQVVLGIMTTKSGKARIEGRGSSAASTRPRKYAPLEQLCILRPIAAFRLDRGGQTCSPRTRQWAKLRRLVEVAGEVWGERHDRRCRR